MGNLESIVEAIVKEGQSWSGETPNDVWYKDQIRPFVQAAYELGLEKAFKESADIADDHDCLTYHELCNCSGAIRSEIDKVLGSDLCACGKCTNCIWRLEHK